MAMGNCQTAEAAVPVAEIQHPDGKLERVYWPLKASHVMTANPGFYVAVVIDSIPGGGGDRCPVKQVKLLRPDDSLCVGHVHRLVSFEDVIRQSGVKKRMRLSRLLQEQKEREERRRSDAGGGESENRSPDKVVEEELVGPTIICRGGRQGQWRPSLNSIAETGI